MSQQVFISRRLRHDLFAGTDRIPVGGAHYSYNNVADSFEDLFREAGMATQEILRPEIQVLPEGEAALHLIFKPFDEIRILHGARNIVHVAWEFDRVSTRMDWLPCDARHSAPFQDYIKMLMCVDEVWVGSTFAGQVFSRYGVPNIKVIPAPISMAGSIDLTRRERALARRGHATALDTIQLIGLDHQHLSSIYEPGEFIDTRASSVVAGKTVFCAVLNHTDLRKNLPALLDGFSLASRDDTVLILKLVMDNKHITKRDFAKQLPDLYRIMGRHLGQVSWRNIYISSDYLNLKQMRALYLHSDFYLTATVAEGQNLPILEAGSMGAIPVSGHHTAMLDYLNEDNSVRIGFRQEPAPKAFADAYGIERLKIAMVSAEDVSKAVGEAIDLPEESKRKMEQNFWEVLVKGFGHDAVLTKVREAIHLG